MTRLLARGGILLGSNALGLLVAGLALRKMHIDVTSFIVAVVIFTVATVLLNPLLAKALSQRGSAALGGVALIATLASLIITDLVSNGLSIDGPITWLTATVIVWIVSLVAGLVLPFLGLKKYLETS